MSRNLKFSQRLLIVAFFLCITSSLRAQEFLHRWSTNLGYGQGNAVATDQYGNAYVTGKFSGTVDFDPGPGVYNLAPTGVGFTDIFLAKYNKDGALVWANKMGSGNQDEGLDLFVDEKSNVYLTGWFQGGADFDSGLGNATIYSNGDEDIFLTENGDYQVLVTDDYGCSGISSTTNINSVGIGADMISGISIYPNPSKGIFTRYQTGVLLIKL